MADRLEKSIFTCGEARWLPLKIDLQRRSFKASRLKKKMVFICGKLASFAWLACECDFYSLVYTIVACLFFIYISCGENYPSSIRFLKKKSDGQMLQLTNKWNIKLYMVKKATETFKIFVTHGEDSRWNMSLSRMKKRELTYWNICFYFIKI